MPQVALVYTDWRVTVNAVLDCSKCFWSCSTPSCVTADVRKLLWPSMANFATLTLPVLQLRKLSKYSYQQTTDTHRRSAR